MSPITSGKVLVTGATGYIAQWTVNKLLEQGFSVRGTVRSESKGAPLKEFFRAHGDRLELVVVEDMTADGAFDEAVKGVDAIMHIASPVPASVGDPDEVIRPAVAGTTGILISAMNHGDSLKRFVFTSSCGAVYSIPPQFRTFSEEDWNEEAVQEVETKGRDAGVSDKYRASKIFAERAVWAFFEEHKQELKFDLVVLNPPGVFGPQLIFTATKLEELNGSMAIWARAITTPQNDSYLDTFGGEYIDVRDAASAHVLAIQKESASGERIIVSAGPYKLQHFVNAAHAFNDKLPAGNLSFDPANPKYAFRFDISKANRIFGIKYLSLEQTTVDILEQLKDKGLVP